MDFKNFKKNKKKFIEQAKKMNIPKNNYEDPRFWTPSKDDTGNGESLIRFLPQRDIDKNPIVMYFQHFFKEKGKYFVERCPFTWEKECPICNYVQPFWEGSDDDKKIAGKYGRKRQYISNILVIKDLVKPENNGKVFLYRFGIKIFEKIINKINPKSELDKEIAVYDLWEGMNFKLKIKKVYGFPNYDSSEFTGEITPVADSDEKIEKIYNSILLLDEFIDLKDCKTFDVLSKNFFKMINKKEEKIKDDVFEKEEEKESPFNESEEEKSEDVLEDDKKTSKDNDEEPKDEKTFEDDSDDNSDDDDWDWDD